jgi:hypothetical protein
MEIPDPFSALQIAPTLDKAQVKRAYFTQLQRHPPHADPDGFRRVRSAYEVLSAPGALPLAYITAPLDAAAELAAWRERWEMAVRQAGERARQAAESDQAVESFVAIASRLPLGEALDRFGGESGQRRAPEFTPAGP